MPRSITGSPPDASVDAIPGIEFISRPAHARHVRALPVIERELIAAARKPWTARTRILFALAAVVTCLAVMAVPRIPTRDRGPLLLIALGILSFLFALLSGCFLTADCVSREKREGTLGLLFLTPLRYRDVVLGKLVSNSIVVVYGLLAVFPVFFLPLLHGGVTWAEVVRVLLALLVCLSLSLTVGMLCSVCSSEAKTAVAATFAIVLLLAVVPFGYALLQAGFQGRPPTFLGAAQFSPTVLLLLSFDEAYRLVSPFAFWGLIGVNLGLPVAAFVFPERLHMNSEALAGFTTLYVGGMATASADRRALAWVGLRQSLIAPTHLRAALMTLTQVMLPGWLLFGGALLVLANARSGSTLTLILMFWYIGCLMSSLAVTIHSRTHLQHRFRELATGGLG